MKHCREDAAARARATEGEGNQSDANQAASGGELVPLGDPMRVFFWHLVFSYLMISRSHHLDCYAALVTYCGYQKYCLGLLFVMLSFVRWFPSHARQNALNRVRLYLSSCLLLSSDLTHKLPCVIVVYR